MTSSSPGKGEAPGAQAGGGAIYGRGGSPELSVDPCQRVRVASLDESGARLVEISLTAGYLEQCLEVLRRNGLIPTFSEGVEQPVVAPRHKASTFYRLLRHLLTPWRKD